MKGFSLPVWVAAAAKAATKELLGKPFLTHQSIEIPNSSEKLLISVDLAFCINSRSTAIAVSHCQSGIALDLTNGLAILACVQLVEKTQNLNDLNNNSENDFLKLVPGFGAGKNKFTDELSLSNFALELLRNNLKPLIPDGNQLRLEIIFPEGKELAKRTSNESFGVIDGLALIGLQAETHHSASPDQLQKTLDQLRKRCQSRLFNGDLVFVIGENGLDLALNLGLSSEIIVKTGNWIGPLIVAAAECGVKDLLLFGYHGKLIKLAGGIFHTHHHLADGRLEVLTALAVRERLPLSCIELITNSSSIEEAFRTIDLSNPKYSKRLWSKLASEVEMRSFQYVNRYGSYSLRIGSALFDKKRNLRSAGKNGLDQLRRYDLNIK